MYSAHKGATIVYFNPRVQGWFDQIEKRTTQQQPFIPQTFRRWNESPSNTKNLRSDSISAWKYLWPSLSNDFWNTASGSLDTVWPNTCIKRASNLPMFAISSAHGRIHMGDCWGSSPNGLNPLKSNRCGNCTKVSFTALAISLADSRNQGVSESCFTANRFNHSTETPACVNNTSPCA